MSGGRGGGAKRVNKAAEPEGKAAEETEPKAEEAAGKEPEAKASAKPDDNGGITPIDGTGAEDKGGPPPASTPKAKRFPYQVAKGKSVSCCSGIIDAGEEIRVKDLQRGPADAADAAAHLEKLVAGGIVVKQ